MYNMIDAEFFVSCFFFIIAIIVLNFWLINLFVAVITHTFAAIRSATSKSAFGAAPKGVSGFECRTGGPGGGVVPEGLKIFTKVRPKFYF